MQRALPLLLASLLVWASVSDAATPTKAKKKAIPVEPATPKRKVRPTETPEATPKPARSTPPAAAVKNPDAEPEAAPPAKSSAAPNAAIAPEEIMEYRAQPASVRKLIESALDLARQNFTYTFGSADPANGGLDCSGFVHYLLRQHGLTQMPCDSSGLYLWLRKAHGFRAVISRKLDSVEMDELLPGDVLFWIGTYATAHDPPITHVMIYLGTEKTSGAKIMIGSSDGRTYHGQKRNGVSVFDFTMSRTQADSEQGSTLIGYARIPCLRD